MFTSIRERTMATRRRTAKRAHKSVPRKHRVSAKLRIQDLSKAGTGIKLFVHADDQKLGEMDIGRGAIYWRGGNKQKWERIDWTRFAEMMDELVYQKR